eukprot:g28827.t1
MVIDDVDSHMVSHMGGSGSHMVFDIGERNKECSTYPAKRQHPTSIYMQRIIRRHFRHLLRDATTRHIFPYPVFSAFRGHRSLQDIMVHSSFTPNTFPKPYGTFPCNCR